MDDLVVASMKSQVVKHYREKSWESFLEGGYVGCDDEDQWDFENTTPGDKFVIGVMVVVPFTTFDSSLHGEVVATHNLISAGHIEHEQAEVNVYHKRDQGAPAYFLYVQAEEGPTLYEV